MSEAGSWHRSGPDYFPAILGGFNPASSHDRSASFTGSYPDKAVPSEYPPFFFYIKFFIGSHPPFFSLGFIPLFFSLGLMSLFFHWVSPPFFSGIMSYPFFLLVLPLFPFLFFSSSLPLSLSFFFILHIISSVLNLLVQSWSLDSCCLADSIRLEVRMVDGTSLLVCRSM